MDLCFTFEYLNCVDLFSMPRLNMHATTAFNSKGRYQNLANLVRVPLKYVELHVVVLQNTAKKCTKVPLMHVGSTCTAIVFLVKPLLTLPPEFAYSTGCLKTKMASYTTVS